MRVPKDYRKLDTARYLRKNMTPQEKHLWYDFLRTYPVKVYKQRIIGKYIADFYCAGARLVIEVDGAQHFHPEGHAADRARTEFFERFGLKVVRYSNSDITNHFSAVCESIDNWIQKRNSKKTIEKGSPSGRAGSRQAD